MIRFHSLFFLLLCILSCSKSDRDQSDNEEKLTVNKVACILSGETTSHDSIIITASSGWKISTDPSPVTWLHLNAASGSGDKTITLTVAEANTSNADRTVRLKISLLNGADSAIVTVTQQKRLVVRAKSFENLFFVNVNLSDKPQVLDPRNEQFYSTLAATGAQPFGDTAARKKIDQIDLVYFGVRDYGDIGFIDPVTASQQWYWDYVNKPWLLSAIQTKFYITNLTKAQFDSSKNDVALLDKYFSDTMSVRLALHRIYPNGACIGGRNASQMYDPILKRGSRFRMGDVFGFVNVQSGKKGLIYIRLNQNTGWEHEAWINNNGTYVDIVKQG
jgi:hypothetical protein